MGIGKNQYGQTYNFRSGTYSRPQKCATMVLLRDGPYHRLCSPGARSALIKSLYTSQVTPCALGFAKNEGEMPRLPPSYTTIRQGYPPAVARFISLAVASAVAFAVAKAVSSAIASAVPSTDASTVALALALAVTHTPETLYC